MEHHFPDQRVSKKPKVEGSEVKGWRKELSKGLSKGLSKVLEEGLQ